MKKRKDISILVLNKAYVAIQLIDLKKAMSLLYQEHAFAMDRDYSVYRSFNEWLEYSRNNSLDYPSINTVNNVIFIPEIILLSKYDKLPDKDVKFTRQSVFARDNFLCCYCNKRFPKDLLTIDHIVPRDHGGQTLWNNVVSSCKPCNGFKRNRTPKEAGLKMHFQPKKPKWISPVSNISPDHPCKSWRLFLNRANVDLGS